MRKIDLREHLQAIYDKHGYLDQDLVVAEATPRSHPLHAMVFDKLQKDAAAEYYRLRAHELITSVRVVYREGDEHGPSKDTRYFRAVQSAPNTFVYEPIDEIAKDEFKRTLVLRDMERQWKQLYRTYGDLEEFFELRDERPPASLIMARIGGARSG